MLRVLRCVTHEDVGVVPAEKEPLLVRGRRSKSASVHPGTESSARFDSLETSTRFRKPSSALWRISASGQAAMSRSIGITSSLVCKPPVAAGPPASTVSSVSLVSPSESRQLPACPPTNFPNQHPRTRCAVLIKCIQRLPYCHNTRICLEPITLLYSAREANSSTLGASCSTNSNTVCC